jgi:hypothetical protein
MSAKQIEITVSPTGDVKVQAKGYTGRSCFDAAAEIERALGEPAGPAQRTAEYYQAATTSQHERLGQ